MTEDRLPTPSVRIIGRAIRSASAQAGEHVLPEIIRRVLQSLAMKGGGIRLRHESIEPRGFRQVRSFEPLDGRAVARERSDSRAKRCPNIRLQLAKPLIGDHADAPVGNAVIDASRVMVD